MLSRLAKASIVMAETTWRATDSTRIVLRQMLHEAGYNPTTRIEVEDVETAVELVGMGLADSILPRGVVDGCHPTGAEVARLGVLLGPPGICLVGGRAPHMTATAPQLARAIRPAPLHRGGHCVAATDDRLGPECLCRPR